MRFGSRERAKQWAKFALKAGLVLTDAQLWAAINDDLKSAASSVSERLNEKLDGSSTRMRDSRLVVRRGSPWASHALTLISGIGIGVGLGLLYAPSSGEQTRSTLRDKASEIKNKVSDAAGGIVPFRSATGTSGD